MANTWNGTFPDHDNVTDGYHHAAPVGTFGQSPAGLQDMAGNLWEWCENVKQPYADLLAEKPIVVTPERSGHSAAAPTSASQVGATATAYQAARAVAPKRRSCTSVFVACKTYRTQAGVLCRLVQTAIHQRALNSSLVPCLR